MSTSGTSTFVANRDMIVRRALRMVGAYTSTDLPRPEQMADACSVLNMMIKTWSTEGFLWLRQEVNVPLVAGQAEYSISDGVTSTTPDVVADRPTHVFNATRKAAAGNEIPLVQLTRTDWFNIPNKSVQSTPVQFYYQARATVGNLKIWPAPQTGTTDVIVLDCDRQLDIMNDSLNDFDFPPTWLEPICYSLAARLAPEYGLPLSERQILEREAEALMNSVLNDDRDLGSVFFGVRK